MLSIIVPVYNEEQALPAFLRQVADWDNDVEVVFSDGGSTDATLSLLNGHRVVRGPKGRGGQCNRGVQAAQGDALLVLHADVRVDANAFSQIQQALEQGARWGCLTLRWDLRTPVYRFGEWMSNLRAGVGRIPFADQGMFFDRGFFAEIGGFPDMAIMEDYELSRRLKRLGVRPRQLPARIHVSARRFEEGGPVRTALLMWRLRRWYRRGMPPDQIASHYVDIRGGEPRA